MKDVATYAKRVAILAPLALVTPHMAKQLG